MAAKQLELGLGIYFLVTVDCGALARVVAIRRHSSLKLLVTRTFLEGILITHERLLVLHYLPKVFGLRSVLLHFMLIDLRQKGLRNLVFFLHIITFLHV